MSQPIRVLLLGKHTASSVLFRHFERYDCECSFAGTVGEGLDLGRTKEFDFVLSTCRMSEAMEIVLSSGSANCSAFCAFPVEESYWWLPLINKGRKCMGEPALRPREFAELLDRMLDDIHRNGSISEEKLTETRKAVA